uniref:Uncharacterized protein n=1 Tax=Oryza barthii TaxID=65489 RepID=A0A0D3F577_9ORYZ
MAPATQMAAPPPRGGSFRVLRTARVAPSSPDGVPSLRQRAVPLTFLDAMWLPTPPVDRVFLYRLGAADDDVDAVLSRLADSLSRVLHVFYPLAGRLRLTPGKTNRYELFYQPGDAVAFTVAEQDDGVGVDELAADDPREVAKIAPLVPELPDGGAVLAVQATVLLPPARRGLALGVTVHHAACDGSSSTHFLHTWAAACAGAVVLPKPPVIDRTFIREREDLYDYMVSRTKEESDKFRSPDVADSKLLATFTLSGEILQSIKDRVAGVAARRGAPLPRCTSIVATFAVVWQCHIRAALASDVEAENNPRNHGRAHFVFPTDHRARMEPRVPDNSTHFLHTWAAACAGAVVLPKPPVIDRTFIREREDLYDIMVNRTKEESDKFSSPDVADNKLLATFTLSGEILQNIKDIVAGVAARRGASPPPRCTSIVATFAVIWQCHIRAALASDVEAENNPRNHGRAHFVFPTDHRARMEPRVPDKYLGNCVGPCFASAPKKEIAAADAEDGLFTTCAAIAAAIDEGTRYDPDYWKRCTEHVGGMSASDGPPLAVAGSPRFRVYDVDFGFGRPTKVDVVSVAKTGAISVAEGRGGGIEVGVGLPPERMERFRRCFTDAVTWLSSPSSSDT